MFANRAKDVLAAMCYVHNVLVLNDAGKCSCTSFGTNMRN
jgi:hypothetical protein